MINITPEELQILQFLLAKIENRHVVMAILSDTILSKYNGNKSKTARALGYTVRAFRMRCNDFIKVPYM
jgi:hypothetical protein